MATLIVLHPPPVDAAKFDRAYAEEHIPMCQEKRRSLRGRAHTPTTADARKSNDQKTGVS